MTWRRAFRQGAGRGADRLHEGGVRSDLGGDVMPDLRIGDIARPAELENAAAAPAQERGNG